MIGRSLKFLALLALLVAISIGVVGKCAPHVFMRIPKVGFILWAITGNHMPPNFDPHVWEDGQYQRFMQDGDVVLASGAKAGTVWLMHVIHALRAGGKDDFKYIWDTVGMMEMRKYPGQTFEDRFALQQAKFDKLPADMPARRIWWGHTSPSERHKGLNPKLNKKIKYILIVRNGMEVTRSFHTFLNSFTDDMKALFGGFPPYISPEETLKLITQDQPQFFFEYTSNWWQYRKEANVLVLHYANLRMNLSATLSQLAEFLGILLTEKTRKEVLFETSFDYMKAKKERACLLFGYPGQKEFCHTSEHLQSGLMDKGKGFFTESMQKTWTKYEDKYFGEDQALRKWVAQGGPVP